MQTATASTARAAAGDAALRAGRRLLAGRTFQVLVGAAVVVLGLAAARAVARQGMDEDLFWRAKLEWHACADVVIVGDSRPLSAVSPAVLADVLGGARVRNFGFVGERFRPEYLEAVAAVLDPASPQRRIILGITPTALTPGSPKRSWFLRYRAELQNQTVLARPQAALATFLAPMPPKDVGLSFASLAGLDRPKVVYLPDGWVTCWPQGPVEREELANYRLIFAKERPDPQRRADVLAFTARWSRAGIRVYGFRPPTTPEMLALETELSGFDEAAFVGEFAAAGGIWLAVDPVAYTAFDHSHLDAPTAQRFTRDLGEQLRSRERAAPAAAP